MYKSSKLSNRAFKNQLPIIREDMTLIGITARGFWMENLSSDLTLRNSMRRQWLANMSLPLRQRLLEVYAPLFQKCFLIQINIKDS